MKAEARLHALADTVENVGAETLYETLSNIKADMLVELKTKTTGDTERSRNQGFFETLSYILA